jgi:lysophospholipase L1-like esterase
MGQTFKLLALGDSVMWGQGLAAGHRFVDLVAGYIASTGKQVEIASLAHSGAVVCTAPTGWARYQDWLFGELPRSFPSVSSQLEAAAATAGYDRFLQVDPWDQQAWQDHKRQVAAQVASYHGAGGAPPDLILVDGGINDLGALQIVVPWYLGSQDPCPAPAPPSPSASVTGILGAIRNAGGDLTAFDPATLPGLQDLPPDQFKGLIDKYLTTRMRTRIDRLAAAFPKSRVIVTGYFPIFTAGSIDSLTSPAVSKAAPMLFARPQSPEQLKAALAWALNPATDQADLANRIVDQSALWYSYSTAQLAQIVADANRAHGDRFALASPRFGPDNGALAPASWLWTFTSFVDDVIREILKLLGGLSPAGQPALALGGVAAALGPEAIGFPDDWGKAVEFLAGLTLGASLATDEAAVVRRSAAVAYYVQQAYGRSDPETTGFRGFTTGVASAGHPNLEGAQAYYQAIRGVL